jgi:hypothetical protein
VQVDVTSTAADTYQARLRVQTNDGVLERTLDTPRCETFTQTVALLVAISVDPRRLREAMEPTDEHAAPAPPPVEPPEPPVVPNVEDDSTKPDPISAPPQLEIRPRAGDVQPRVPTRGFVAPMVAVGWGPLPRVGAVVGANAGLMRGWFSAEVASRFWLPQQATFADAPMLGGRLWLWTLGVRVCGRFGRAAIAVGGCGGVDAGLMHGLGEGAPQTERARRPFVGTVVGLRFWWTLHRLVALVVMTDAHAAVYRPVFEIRGVGELHRAAVVGLHGGLGLEVRFP